MRLFYLVFLLLEVIGKKCHERELSTLTISSTLEMFQKRVINISKFVECTNRWLSNRKIHNSVDLDTKTLASKLDKDLKGFGIISLALQGIPVMMNKHIWDLNSFTGFSLNGNNIREIIKKSGAIPFVVEDANSSVLIRDSMRRNEALLGMVSEDTLSFINSCISLLCLQASSPELMNSPLLEFKPKIGLIANSLEDLVLSYKALLMVSYKNVKHGKEYENYDMLKKFPVVLVPINSSDWYQPCFGPIANRLYELDFNMQVNLLEGAGVTDGVLSLRKALDFEKFDSSLTKAQDYKNSVGWDSEYLDGLKKDSYKDILSGNQLEILNKPSVLKENYHYKIENQLWKRDASRRIISRLVDSQLHEFVITPSYHSEFIKLIEHSQYPTLTIASQYFKDSMTIVSLHSNDYHLVHLAQALLSF